MMTPKAVSRGDNTTQYFLATEYYLGRDGKPREPSHWQGKGAEALKLAGQTVAIADFEKLLEGFDPNMKKLTQNAGSKSRNKQGVDATNSPPKSVSIAMAYASPEMREAIMKASEAANQASIAYLEKNLTIATGRGGKENEPVAGLCVASFLHYTSRALDPQMHHHNIVMMAAQRADGTWGGLDERDIKIHQKAAGALYRAELAQRLNALGFTVKADERNDWAFGIEGITEEMELTFSQRRQDILKELKRKGLSPSDKEACDRACRATRDAKNEPRFEDMLKVWEIRGEKHGLNADFIDSIAKGQQQHAEAAIDHKALIGKITEQLSTFERKDVIAAVAVEASRNGGLSSEKCLEITEGILKRETVWLGEQVKKSARINDELKHPTRADILNDEAEQRTPVKIADEFQTQKITDTESRKLPTRHLFTTPEVLKREIALYDDFKASQSDHRHDRSPEAVARAMEGYEAEMSAKLSKAAKKQISVRMKDEQTGLLKHVATGGRQVLIQGLSGTGKSFAFGAVRRMEEEAGQTVIATALAGKAASGLKEGASIKEGGTLASILIALESGKLKATERTTFILDEAGMVGADDFQKLQRLAPQSKICILGDKLQYQNIAGGNFFAGLQDLGFKKAELGDIERQKLAWHKQAVLDLKDGNGAKALQAFADNGLLIFKETQEEALKTMAKDYTEAKHLRGDKIGEAVDFKNKVAMCGQHAQTRIVNDEVRRLLIEDKKLGDRGFDVEFANKDKSKYFEREIRIGERLRFTKNAKVLGIMNGENGTIEGITQRRDGDFDLSVRHDNGKLIKFGLSEYAHLEHGYCATGHSSQGVSEDYAFDYLDKNAIDKQAGYVLNSRSKQETKSYASTEDSESIEEAFGKLAKAISKDNSKDWTLDYLSEKQRDVLRASIEGNTPATAEQLTQAVEAAKDAPLTATQGKAEEGPEQGRRDGKGASQVNAKEEPKQEEKAVETSDQERVRKMREDYVKEQNKETAAALARGRVLDREISQDGTLSEKETNDSEAPKQAEKAKEKKQERDGTSEAPILASTLAKGTRLVFDVVLYAGAAEVLVKAKESGRYYLFDNSGVLAAEATDGKGIKQSVASSLKDRILGGELIIGDKGQAAALTVKDRTFKAMESGKLAEQAGTALKPFLKPVASLSEVGRKASRGFTM